MEEAKTSGMVIAGLDPAIANLVSELFAAASVPVTSFSLADGDPGALDQGLRREILGIADASEKVREWLGKIEPSRVIFMDDIFHCSYVVLRQPNEEKMLVVGPVLFQRMTPERIRKLLRELELGETLRTSMENYYSGLALMHDQGLFERLICVGADYVFGKGRYQIDHITYPNAAQWNDLFGASVRIPEKPFLNVRHIEQRFELEGQILTAISNGNDNLALDTISRLLQLMSARQIPGDAQAFRYDMVAMNTLMRKAAEQSGVHPVYIDTYFRQCNKEISTLQGEEDCVAFIRKTVLGYCSMVKEHRFQGHSYAVRRVITYVSTDIAADLSLSSLAAELNINSSYLSTLFRKEMGVPLTEYVNRARVNHAKRLLETTNLPIKSVAAQIGITDMPYFSRLFRRIAGTTPKAYREQKYQQVPSQD